MWFGTSEGIGCYDGGRFSEFVLPGGLEANFVNQVHPDEDGSVWIAANYRGATRLHNGTFAFHPVDPLRPEAKANRTNTFLRLADSVLLVGTDSGLFAFNGTAFTPLLQETPVAQTLVLALHHDARGSLWIGTYQGLFRSELDGATYKPKNVSAVQGAEGLDVRTFAAVGEGIWVGTIGGLRWIRLDDPDRFAALPRQLKPLERKAILAIELDDQGSLWIGTSADGLYKYSVDGSIVHYTVANGLSGNRVADIHVDRERNLWFATNAGVAKLTGTQVINYTLPGHLANAYVSAICATGPEEYWFGTPGGLARLDGDTYTVFGTSSGLGGDYVLYLLRDRRGLLWAAAGGLARWLPKGDRFVTYRDESHPEGTFVRSILEDHDGNLWVGKEFGVSLFHEGRFINHELPVTGNSNLPLTIFQDPMHNVWVGTQGNGVFRFSVEAGPSPSLRQIAHYSTSTGLVDQNIRCGFVDRDGDIWLGTRFSGVMVLRMFERQVQQMRSLRSVHGLSAEWIRFMLQSRDGDIWIATSKGVDRFRKDADSVRFISSLSVSDGLAGDGAFALYEDTRGDIWIGAQNGVTRYTPTGAPTVPVAPLVWITQFSVLGAVDSIALTRGHASLKPDQQSVSFEFIAPSFKDETKVQYSYMLEGLDDDWSVWTTRRYVNYTHLPPWEYAFKVRARSSSGIESEAPAVFAFSIAAPYWQKWWFAAMIVATIAGAIIGLHRYRVRKLLELERMRMRIAADLHDDIGSTLSSISIFSEMARQEATAGAPRAAELLARIGESSRSVLESLDDIVWAINPKNDSLEEFAARIRDYATEVFESRGIRFAINLPHELRPLPMDRRRHVYLIIKEAVNNIVRHAQCTETEIGIQMMDDTLTIHIKDNGKGLSPTGPAGDGLNNMRLRAALLEGRVDVESSPGKGTIITLCVPIT